MTWRIGRLHILFKWAPPKTCWWNNVKGFRLDMLIGLNRYYSREDGIYLWALYAGRLCIKWGIA